MAGTNASIVKKAFKGYSQHIDKVVYNALDKWCEQILREAVFARLNPMDGHNFTGNLINSIVVILYSKSQNRKTTYFADSTGLKPAIRKEFSAMTTRKTRRKNRIRINPDWSGRASILRPENLIPTDESYGFRDARQFASAWVPSIDADFVICVAYTSEYAKFVEMERATTGYLETIDFVDRTAIEWVGLK